MTPTTTSRREPRSSGAKNLRLTADHDLSYEAADRPRLTPWHPVKVPLLGVQTVRGSPSQGEVSETSVQLAGARWLVWVSVWRSLSAPSRAERSLHCGRCGAGCRSRRRSATSNRQ